MPDGNAGTAEELSGREHQVARLYAEGRSYKEIARALAIAPSTVRTHLNSIFRKLEVTNKVELLRKLEVRGERPCSNREDVVALGSGAMPETEQIAALLENLGLGEYLPLFRTNHVDDALLPTLTDHDLRAIGVEAVGHRKRLLRAIAGMATGGELAAESPTVAEAGAARSAERRQLTVAFVDLVESTALATALDPEHLREVLGAYRRAVTDQVARYGGYVSHLLGDGVLACFGWPRAHEDDPERAVRAGLAAAGVVSQLQAPRTGRLACRVGIATGLVVVGDLACEGSGATGEGIVGTTPNLAARLQAIAEPGTVVIADSTRRLVGELFAYEDLGQLFLKGLPGPVQGWRVTGEGGGQGRFAALRGANPMPLVGRRQELTLMLDRWEHAKEGEGQVVLLSGEAGIGKSRLVRALQQELGEEPHTPFSYYCSPHHMSSALYSVIGWLERVVGLDREESPACQLAKLEAMIASAVNAARENILLLADLLEIPTKASGAPSDLSTPLRKERTFQVLLDHMASFAARQPVLALYDDVHWADPTTIEFLHRVIDGVQRLPVLVVITFRPEFAPPWTGYGHVTALSLGRLGRRDGATMVEQVAGGKALPDEMLARLLARADGVPLFLEELTKAVIESGMLHDLGDRYELKGVLLPSAIPETLQDSLMARLDRLAPVREVAQIGAVIGREFTYELLAAVVSLDDDALRDALGQLVGAELIFRRGEPPAATYAFKHALVRDAAYESLLKSRRQQLHARIVEVLEQSSPQNIEMRVDLLAHHCTEAGLTQKAVDYRCQAGRRALQHSAVAEAAAQARSGLELLSRLPVSLERMQWELDLRITIGLALLALHGTSAEEVGQAFARARELCGSTSDGPELFQALFGKWLFHYTRAELEAGQAIAEEFLQSAERQDDPGIMLTGYRIAGASALTGGNPLAARCHYEQALALPALQYRSSRFAYSFDARVVCSHHLAWTLFFLGYPKQAMARSQEASSRARGLCHPSTLALSLFFESVFGQFLCAQAMAQQAADALVVLAGEQCLPFWSAAGVILQGSTLMEGEKAEGIRRIRQGMSAYRTNGGALYWPYFLALLAKACGKLGQTKRAVVLVAEALASGERSGEHWYEAELRRQEGELLLALTYQDRAEACFRRALMVARQQGAKLWELRAAVSLARLWLGRGERQKAYDLLAPLHGWFTEGFANRDFVDASQLLQTMGEPLATP